MLPHAYPRRGPKYIAPKGDHILVAADLGAHKLGFAAGLVVGNTKWLFKAATFDCGFSDPAMVAATFREFVALHTNAVRGRPPIPLVMVCEWPMKYTGKRSTHASVDRVLAVGDAIGGWRETYLPGQWKGNVPKAVHRRRLMDALSPGERERMPPEDEHDAWDAAGIWLFATGRTQRGGVK